MSAAFDLIVFDLVRELAQRSGVAALTNNGAVLRETIADLASGVAAAFGDRFHATSEFAARKPEPAVFERLLARYGVPPSRAAFIDDAPANVEGARRAGLHAILCQSAPTRRAELDRLLGVQP